MLAAAAYTLSRPLVLASLGAVLINGLAHFVFHAGHQGKLSDSDQASNLIALATPVVVVIALLFVEFARTPKQTEGQACYLPLRFS